MHDARLSDLPMYFQDIDALMSEGNKSRTVAATNMNSESSRSHAVFSIILTATLSDTASGVSTHGSRGAGYTGSRGGYTGSRGAGYTGSREGSTHGSRAGYIGSRGGVHWVTWGYKGSRHVDVYLWVTWMCKYWGVT